MFHAVAQRKVEATFRSLSKGDYEPALLGIASQFEHRFAGDHALGGSRNTVEGLRAWFQRLYRLFPNLDFEVRSISASGPPWDITVVAEWIDRASPAGGGRYENTGVHVVRIVWGKLASIHAYLDAQVLNNTLRATAASGVAEAVASPITDADVRPMHRSRLPPPPAKISTLRGTAISSTSTMAIGALATGALAIGAVAIGRLVIRRLTIRQARIKRLEIDELVVKRTVMRSEDG
jgi:ketosteroid isomerase-like protein